MSKVVVNDDWQRYEYTTSEPVGENFSTEFTPSLTPKDMLELGVFGGVYFFDKPKEFPGNWYEKAKLSNDGQPNKDLNYFGVNASQSLSVWQKKGWIHPEDPRGWFQWYARYYMGRRIDDEDARQIGRWRAMKRHVVQVQKNCAPKDKACRRRQKQALLHWAYDSINL